MYLVLYCYLDSSACTIIPCNHFLSCYNYVIRTCLDCQRSVTCPESHTPILVQTLLQIGRPSAPQPVPAEKNTVVTDTRIHLITRDEEMRRKEERSKQGQTNKQGKATQHTQGNHFVHTCIHVYVLPGTCIYMCQNVMLFLWPSHPTSSLYFTPLYFGLKQ